jgi:hypothetical protein
MSILSAITGHPMALLALGLGLCLAACGSVLIRRALGRRVGRTSWPSVEGVILESVVVANREGRQSFRPVVRYAYAVDGVCYEGHRIASGEPVDFAAYTRARRVLDAYRPGGTVIVHYDPARPGVSVLRPGMLPVLPPALAIAPAAAVSALLVAVLIGASWAVAAGQSLIQLR